MFKFIRWLLGSRLVSLPMLLVLLWQGWMLIKPKQYPLDDRRRVVADQAAGRLAESLPEPPAGKPTLMVAQFENDPTGTVTQAVREAIDRVGRYAVRSTTVVQNVYRELGIEEKPLALEDAATVDLEPFGCDYLLVGRVGSLQATSDEDRASLEAVLVAADESFEPLQLSARSSRDHRQTAAAKAVLSYPWPARMVSWLALALLLPLVFAPLVGRGLERESNAVNLGMLVGLTLVAALAAFAMLGFQLPTGWSGATLVAATALAGGYNWCVLSKLEDLRN